MGKVSGLLDFLEKVTNREYLLIAKDFQDNEPSVRTNSIVKDFMDLIGAFPTKSKMDTLLNDDICEYIDQYYEFIYSCVYQRHLKNSKKEQEIEIFYRGVSDEKHLLVPGLYRDREKHDENYYFNEINVRCPEIFRNFNNLEKLTYMQHYGCPTRLLDITSNPLVALYFACLNDSNKDGAVDIFAVDSNKILYSNSDRIKMLAKLAEFKEGEQRKLRLLSYRYLLDGKFPKSTNTKYQDSIVERYYQSIRRENVAFERELQPIDILRPQFVQPNKDNPRILKQDGAFIISGLNANAVESDMKIKKHLVLHLVIDGSSKKKILDELEIIGINQATLFPEVDKVADYLRNKKKGIRYKSPI